jgi:soluble lytic murein transglycosylase-like protein
VGSDLRLYMTPGQSSYFDLPAAAVLRVQDEPAATGAPPDSSATKPVAPAAHSTAAHTSPLDVDRLLQEAGAMHHIDPDLLASIVRQESGGNPHAVSRAGALGLMQLMPGTAADLGITDPRAPAQNVAGGTSYLDALLMYYHDDVAKALAAYNAGPAAVDRYHGIPPFAETRQYVARVIHEYNRRKALELHRRDALAHAPQPPAVAAR